MVSKKGNVTRKRKKRCSFKGSTCPKRSKTAEQVAGVQAGPSTDTDDTTNEKQQEPSPSTTRNKKLNISVDNVGEVDETQGDIGDYNIVINLKLLVELFSKAACPICNTETINLSDKLNERMGLVHKLKLSCTACEFEFSMYTHKQCKTNIQKQGRQPFELNIRTIVGFREIGHGHAGMENVMRCV